MLNNLFLFFGELLERRLFLITFASPFFALVPDINKLAVGSKLKGGCPAGSAVKNSPVNAGDSRDAVRSLGWENPLEKEMATTPVFLSGKSHGQKSLAGYNPCTHKRVRHDLVTKQQQMNQCYKDWSRQPAV